ncbi:MAG: carboxypeptidase regulatory-like domain-containing protein [Polyangiaceae bacterium]|nr:carboxypeptidase regulatory-like domain-containing protein [Polyangiaceae bacterium]
MRARALLFVLASSGCSIPTYETLASDAPPANVCTTSAECAPGACIAGACQATSGRLSTVLIEVTPPATAGALAGLALVQVHTGLPAGGGALEIDLDGVSVVTGRVALGARAECALPAGGTLPVEVTLAPSQRLLGLPATVFTTEITVDLTTGAGEFEVRVPPGVYDLYVEPGQGSPIDSLAAPCSFVPQLWERQALSAGITDLELTLELPEVVTLDVLWPASAESLAGWTVDLIDARTGRLLSRPAVLGAAVAEGYSVEVAYLPARATTTNEPGSELVRLRPPEGAVAPTILWERGGLFWFDAKHAEVGPFMSLPTPVEFTARVVSELGEPVAGASVSIVATELTGLPAGTLAAFERSNLQTDADGRVQLAALPGTYRAFATPPSESGLAAREVEWRLSTAPVQAGQEARLGVPARVIGEAAIGFGPGGPPVGATVHATPSAAALNAGVLERAVGRASFVPQPATSMVSVDGSFELRAAPSAYDFSLRPDAEGGFAWVVRPNVLVLAGTAVIDLGAATLRPPARYAGTVASPLGAVPSATVRAYAFLDAESAPTLDPARAASVVQVAESRADAEGRFDLLLPADLD